MKRPECCLTVEVPSQTDLKNPGIIRDFGICPALLEQKINSGCQNLHHTEASIEAIMSQCQKNQLIHFATHGFFPKSDNPFSNSGLLIAGNGELPVLHLNDPDYKYVNEDLHLLSPERILSKEYRKIDLAQSHISLQACVAGYAREGIAGDALGIEWAFLQKGAGSMISTFWNIDLTNANNFYTNFYGEWLDKGSSRAEAHRRSVLQLKNSNHSSNLPDEYYWAGYGLIGDWR
jgi:CHAT domain-containing protein